MTQTPRPVGRVEAVIVAGGFGTRLLPLTERRPQAPARRRGRPFLEHQSPGWPRPGSTTSCWPRRPRGQVRAGARRRQPRGVRSGLRDGGGAPAPAARSATWPAGARRRPGRRGGSFPPATFSRATTARPAGRLPHRPRRPAGRRLAAPGHGRGRAPVRLRAHRRVGRVPRLRGEVREPGDEPDQRRLLRLPPRRYRTIAGEVVSVERSSPAWSPTPALVGFVESAYWRDVAPPRPWWRRPATVLGVAPTPPWRPHRRPASTPRPCTATSAGGSGDSTARRRAGAQVTGSVLMTGARVEEGARGRPTRWSGRAPWSVPAPCWSA